MIQRAIVTIPKFDGREQIDRLRNQFDPLALIIEPHITLVFPFTSQLTTDQLQAFLQGAVQGIDPFSVQLHGITGAEGEYLFLNVKRGNDHLIELHDRLYTGPIAPYLSLEHTFVPHLTVGRLSDRATFLHALQAAQEIRAVFQMTITELTVYRVDNSYPIECRVGLRSLK